MFILLLILASLAPWAVCRLVRVRERPDGAPALALVRLTSAVNVAFAIVFLAAGIASRGRIVTLAHPWRQDIWSALLFGALAGLLLHVLGGGSPLPIASLGGHRRPSAGARDADIGTVVLFVLGEVASVGIWFGAGLPTLLRSFARLLTLPAVAAGYGSGRAAAGQDHALTGAIDGLLLGLLYLLTGSFLATVVAHLLVDALAYVSAASNAENAEMELDAGSPILPQRPLDEQR